MATFDFTPLYRSTIGFDRMFSMLGGMEGPTPSYPPYNIERRDENTYRITVAVAGFAEADLAIEAKENVLTIRGERRSNGTETTTAMLHQGIAARSFQRGFQLAEYVGVKGASMENGLLHVDLVRELPEAMKPRMIAIASPGKLLGVEATKVAA
jgi:molecular chaperone IbpA